MARIELPSGVGLYVDDRGRGAPPIVFVHAWSMSHQLWEHQVVAFMGDHRVVTYDCRGHGASDKPDGDYSPATHAADLHELLGALDLRGVVLVGWSMGVWIVTRYLERHGSSRVAKLVLHSGLPVLLSRPDWQHALSPDLMAGLAAQLGADRPLATEAFYEKVLHRGVSRQTLDWIVRTSVATPLPVAMACFQSLVEDDLRPALASIRVPTAVFHGRQDILPLAGFEALCALVPDARLTTFEHSGHFAQLEEPQAFNDALARFIAS